jgi:hypothetical protein
VSYLNFVPDGVSPSGKTRYWSVETLGGAKLGTIAWFSHWRKYVFGSSTTYNVFDPGCLREIADFADQRTKEHKA